MNGCLFNSEVWSGYTDTNIKDLEIIDHDILRSVVGAQSKVPVEMLYLETAQLPIKRIITVRRLLYLHTILKRHKSELINKIYTAMKEDPLKDDWIHLVDQDKKDIDLNLSDIEIESLSKAKFKTIIKNKIKNCTFLEQEGIKEGHIKVKHIVHSNIKRPQKYLTDPIFSNNQTRLLFNLRSQCENEFKSNFYTSTCKFCQEYPDTQEHALHCKVIMKQIHKTNVAPIRQIRYSNIFGDTKLQHEIVQVFERIILTRDKMRASTLHPAYPGLNTGPSGL